MVWLKSEEEITLIKEGAEILGQAHAQVAALVKPGVTTEALDRVATTYILDHGATPSFKGYNGFKHALCISPNEQVVHGIPGKYELKEGDVVSIDCGVYYKGFHSDSAYTYGVGTIETKVAELLKDTLASLYLGIEQAAAGKRTGDIGFAIQSFVEAKGYSVVRELVGHGVGKHLHEEPEVPNYGKRGRGQLLKKGMVLAIEPMINLGKRNVVQEDDGWTIRTADRMPSAHFEHTVVVLEGRAEILTTHKYIEEVLAK
ncbi:methionine aminopeptidase [Flammeovirgaceae bacterium 311]|nr:methionine aminopeptidase [Flammeovirgaceae bacterium 311]